MSTEVSGTTIHKWRHNSLWKKRGCDMSTACDSTADSSPADKKFLLGWQGVTLLWMVLPCFCAASKVRTIREMKSLYSRLRLSVP